MEIYFNKKYARPLARCVSIPKYHSYLIKTKFETDMADKKKSTLKESLEEEGKKDNDAISEGLSHEESDSDQVDVDSSDVSEEDGVKSTEQVEEMKDQLLRALADVENMRRRSERDVAQANKYGHLAFARDLLSSIDNLSQAVSLAPEDKSNFDENLKNILVGVEMISKEIESVLQRHHITKINPIGEKFNYNHHQAMFEVSNDDIEAGTIVQVAQPGYLLHDRLIRPAMVGVSKKPSSGVVEDENSVDKQA